MNGSVTTLLDMTMSVFVIVLVPSNDVKKYVNVLYSVLMTLEGWISSSSSLRIA